MKKDDAGIAEFALSESELASIVGGVQVVTATPKPRPEPHEENRVAAGLKKWAVMRLKSCFGG